MFLIVGLGNKGLQYRNTFHNIGFMVADKLAKELGLKFKNSKCSAKVAISQDGNVIIAKPETYMNLSGKSIRCLLDEYQIRIQDMVVVYDDIDLHKGVIRVREQGSGGTHNGMRNIISIINTTDFIRVRIGIGRPQVGQDMAEYVLSRLSYEDRKLILPSIDKVTKGLQDYIQDHDIQAMIRNSK